MADIDLTGRWTGVYFYPVDPVHSPFDDYPPTPFLAELCDVAVMQYMSIENPPHGIGNCLIGVVALDQHG
ncbi:MAG: hypothetical protein ACK51B_01230, partial [bacterium]